MRCAMLALVVPLALGCSATASSSGGFGGGGAGSGSSGSTGSGAGSSSSGSTGLGGGFTVGTGGGGGGGGAPEIAEVFAHSPSVLYRLDPDTKVFSTVGALQGCPPGGVIDLAIDKDGAMFVTTFGSLYKVDKATAVCTHVADGEYPNSLSFVPKGTVDPGVEALVGYLGSDYVRIDPVTGKVTTIGGLGGGYVSSGDIVSAIGGGTYLTVNGNGCSDCIVEVHPKTGDLKKMIGPLGHSAVFGLAFWGGVAYGFDDAGELFQIDLTTGVSSVIPTTPGLEFWGAGSTTAAPLKPPT
jgi:hypothetical protein